MFSSTRVFPILLLIAGVLWSAAADAQSTRRQDRLTAIRLSDQLPSAPDGWAVIRSTRDWQRGGASARRVFRGPGRRTVSVVLEARTLGIMHRHEFLGDPERARRFGYEVSTLPGVSASGNGDGEDNGAGQGESQTEGQGTAEGEGDGEGQGEGVSDGPQQILIKTQGERREIRFWLDDRILVLVIGETDVRELRRFVRRLDLEEIRKIQ